jgi:hypothetical protein
MVTNTLSDFSQLPILQEIHNGIIRAHHAKTGYDYPTIQLPFSFSGLIGLSTLIYQTVHNEAIAFLVVISQSEKAPESRRDRRLHTAEVTGSNPAEPTSVCGLKGIFTFFVKKRVFQFCDF